jgi:hypothetical protein
MLWTLSIVLVVPKITRYFGSCIWFRHRMYKMGNGSTQLGPLYRATVDYWSTSV